MRLFIVAFGMVAAANLLLLLGKQRAHQFIEQADFGASPWPAIVLLSLALGIMLLVWEGEKRK